MPVAMISTSTSPAFGPSRSSSTISSGFFASNATAARVFMDGLLLARLSALHDADRKTSFGCFLIFVAHVPPRLEHRRDHRVEADDIRAVADHRDAAGVARLDRAHRVALDARDLVVIGRAHG